MEDEINTMGAEEILKEGMEGRATIEEWVGALPCGTGGYILI